MFSCGKQLQLISLCGKLVPCCLQHPDKCCWLLNEGNFVDVKLSIALMKEGQFLSKAVHRLSKGQWEHMEAQACMAMYRNSGHRTAEGSTIATRAILNGISYCGHDKDCAQMIFLISGRHSNIINNTN